MLKLMEHNGVYIVQIKPETALEMTLLRDIKKTVQGMDEHEYWDVKPKADREFMDECFSMTEEQKRSLEEAENPFEKEESKEVKEEVKEENKEEVYEQEEFEWT